MKQSKRILACFLSFAIVASALSLPAYAENEPTEQTDAPVNAVETSGIPETKETEETPETPEDPGNEQAADIEVPAEENNDPESADEGNTWDPNFQFDESTGILTWDNFPSDELVFDPSVSGNAYTYVVSIQNDSGIVFSTHSIASYKTENDRTSVNKPDMCLPLQFAYYSYWDDRIGKGDYIITVIGKTGDISYNDDYSYNIDDYDYTATTSFTYTFNGGDVNYNLTSPSVYIGYPPNWVKLYDEDHSYYYNGVSGAVGYLIDEITDNYSVFGNDGAKNAADDRNSIYCHSSVNSKYGNTIRICSVDKNGNMSPWSVQTLGSPELWKPNFKFDPATGKLSWDNIFGLPMDLKTQGWGAYASYDLHTTDWQFYTFATAPYTVDWTTGTRTGGVDAAYTILPLQMTYAALSGHNVVPGDYTLHICGGPEYNAWSYDSDETFVYTYNGGTQVDTISAPQNAVKRKNTIKWDPVDGAVGYIIRYTDFDGKNNFAYSENEEYTEYNEAGINDILGICAVDINGNYSEWATAETSPIGLTYDPNSDLFEWDRVEGTDHYVLCLRSGEHEYSLNFTSCSCSSYAIRQLMYKYNAAIGEYTAEVYSVDKNKTSNLIGSTVYVYEYEEWDADFSYDPETGRLTWENIPEFDPDYKSPYYAVYSLSLRERPYDPGSSIFLCDVTKPFIVLPVYLAWKNLNGFEKGIYNLDITGYQKNFEDSYRYKATYTSVFNGGNVIDTLAAPTLSLKGMDKNRVIIDVKRSSGAVGYISKYVNLNGDISYSASFGNIDSVGDRKWAYGGTVYMCAVDKDGNMSDWSEGVEIPNVNAPTWNANFRYDEETGILSWDHFPYLKNPNAEPWETYARYELTFEDGSSVGVWTGYEADDDGKITGNITPINFNLDLAITQHIIQTGITTPPETMTVSLMCEQDYSYTNLKYSNDPYVAKVKGGKYDSSIPAPSLHATYVDSKIIFTPRVSGEAMGVVYLADNLWWDGLLSYSNSSVAEDDGSWSVGLDQITRDFTLKACTVDKNGNYGDWSEEYYVTKDGIFSRRNGTEITFNSSKKRFEWQAYEGADHYNFYMYQGQQFVCSNCSANYSADYRSALKSGNMPYGICEVEVFAVLANGTEKFIGSTNYEYIEIDETIPVVTVIPGDGKATLTWDAIDGAAKYAAYLVNADGTLKALATRLTDTTYTATKLTNGTEYTFLVRAYVDGKWSKYSANDYVKATPVSAVVKPEVTATPGDEQITITWNEVPDAAKYAVYIVQDDNTLKALATKLTDTTYTAKKLTNGTEYSFLVRAYVNGKWTAYSKSDYVKATPVSMTVKPTVEVIPADKQVTLTWDAIDGATKYAVYRLQDDGTLKALATKLTVTEYTVKKLTNHTEYQFLVRAYVNGKWTKYDANDYVSVTPAALKPLVRVSEYDGMVTLRWGAVDDATKYAAYIVNDDGSLTCVSSKITNIKYTIKNLTNGTAYRFVVRAYVNGKWTKYTDRDIVSATPNA